MRLNLKRLALLAGTCARAVAARVQLTPQRVDLMLVVREGDQTQVQLAQRLCVTPPVVSRMLKALRELGLVDSVVDPCDSRRRIPRLTEAGLERLARSFPKPTRRGAQTRGEAEWLRGWRAHLAKLGIRVDSILRGHMPRTFGVYSAWNSRYGHYELEHMPWEKARDYLLEQFGSRAQRAS